MDDRRTGGARDRRTRTRHRPGARRHVHERRDRGTRRADPPAARRTRAAARRPDRRQRPALRDRRAFLRRVRAPARRRTGAPRAFGAAHRARAHRRDAGPHDPRLLSTGDRRTCAVDRCRARLADSHRGRPAHRAAGRAMVARRGARRVRATVAGLARRSHSREPACSGRGDREAAAGADRTGRHRHRLASDRAAARNVVHVARRCAARRRAGAAGLARREGERRSPRLQREERRGLDRQASRVLRRRLRATHPAGSRTVRQRVFRHCAGAGAGAVVDSRGLRRGGRTARGSDAGARCDRAGDRRRIAGESRGRSRRRGFAGLRRPAAAGPRCAGRSGRRRSAGAGVARTAPGGADRRVPGHRRAAMGDRAPRLGAASHRRSLRKFPVGARARGRPEAGDLRVSRRGPAFVPACPQRRLAHASAGREPAIESFADRGGQRAVRPPRPVPGRGNRVPRRGPWRTSAPGAPRRRHRLARPVHRRHARARPGHRNARRGLREPAGGAGERRRDRKTACRRSDVRRPFAASGRHRRARELASAGRADQACSRGGRDRCSRDLARQRSRYARVQGTAARDRGDRRPRRSCHPAIGVDDDAAGCGPGVARCVRDEFRPCGGGRSFVRTGTRHLGRPRADRRIAPAASCARHRRASRGVARRRPAAHEPDAPDRAARRRRSLVAFAAQRAARVEPFARRRGRAGRRHGRAAPGERREPGAHRHRPQEQGARVPDRVPSVRLVGPAARKGDPVHEARARLRRQLAARARFRPRRRIRAQVGARTFRRGPAHALRRSHARRTALLPVLGCRQERALRCARLAAARARSDARGLREIRCARRGRDLVGACRLA